MILSALTVGHFLDQYHQSKHRLGKAKLEDRLPPMVLGSILIPCGMVAFGWSVQYQLHWIAPILFSVLVGYGFVSIAISSWSYLVDVFGIYSASATAGTVILRNAGAAVLPLAGPSLMSKMDIGWAFSVLASLGIITVPVTLILLRVGARLRKAQPYSEHP